MSMSIETIAKVYEERYRNSLVPVAKQLEVHLRDQFSGIDHIDLISARAKELERFIEKAQRQEDGKPHYSEPLSEIQDQLGARIVVYYREDVDRVAGEVKRYYKSIEEQTIIPDSEWKFGYFGKHLILALPLDAIPETVSQNEVPSFFELQIKTLFQHAWSEANHDLGYKSTADLEFGDERKLAYTAAQAWGADEMFQQLYNRLAGCRPGK